MSRIAAAALLLCAANGDVQAREAKLTPALCEMLGMADEYISRFDYYTGKPRTALIESFYPHETKLARAYEKLISAYGKESGVKLRHQRKTGPQGHVGLFSPRLAGIINSLYVKVDRIATLDRKRILGASRACQLRYVTGAYTRYADKGRNAITMANAVEKVETIGLVLKKLGCKNVAVFTTETIPTGTKVFFEPGKEILKALPIKKPLTREEYAKTSPYMKLYKAL